MSEPRPVVAHVPNVFDRARFGADVLFVDSGAEAAQLDPALILVDLDRCADPAEFLLEGSVVIGFGPHVDAAGHQQARDLGYDLVLPRSVFFRRLFDLVSNHQSPEHHP